MPQGNDVTAFRHRHPEHNHGFALVMHLDTGRIDGATPDGGDIAQAHELKKELDHWGIYKEYEDQFLDLFKKPPKKDN